MHVTATTIPVTLKEKGNIQKPKSAVVATLLAAAEVILIEVIVVAYEVESVVTVAATAVETTTIKHYML